MRFVKQPLLSLAEGMRIRESNLSLAVCHRFAAHPLGVDTALQPVSYGYAANSIAILANSQALDLPYDTTNPGNKSERITTC